MIVFISVPDIPVGNGKGPSALPTQNENGIYFFDDQNTYELVCNSSACHWTIKSQKRSVVRQERPITMYLLPKVVQDLCTNCGKNTCNTLLVESLFLTFDTTFFSILAQFYERGK